MNKSNATLIVVGLVSLVVGAGIALFYYSLVCEPNASYKLELNGAKLTNEVGFIAAIKTRGPGKKAVFRDGLTKKVSASASPTIPPGYEDDGLTCKGSRPTGGQHVTQRIGYDNKENLEAVLKFLE